MSEINSVKKRRDSARNAFHHRVVPFWNALPTKVRTAPSVATFKIYLDEAVTRLGLMDIYDDTPRRDKPETMHSVRYYTNI